MTVVAYLRYGRRHVNALFREDAARAAKRQPSRG